MPVLIKTLLIATRNPKKAEELRRILKDTGIVIRSLEDFPDCPEVTEDGETFLENAAKKAITAARHTGLITMADDSGLVVDALGGRPGVYSARYAGEGADDQSNNRKLIAELAPFNNNERRARFVCVIALASREGLIATFEGTVEGTIAKGPRGDKGFGYDPLFIPEGLDKTFGELDGSVKDSISHRGMALNRLKGYLVDKQNY